MPRRKIHEKEVARYWDGNADLWAKQVGEGWDYYREYLNNPFFFEFIGSVEGKRVLDAGCGEGRNTRLLAARGADVVGVDISRKMIRHARKAEREKPLGIRYELISYSDLSIFDDATFDMTVSFMAMMDGPDYKGALREFHRVLRPGGGLFFSVTHPCFMTKGFGWICDEKGKHAKLTVSDYFDKSHYVDRWRFSKAPYNEKVKPFSVAYFPKTITEYINGLIKTGFIVKKIGEPRPTAQMCREHSWLKRWRKHAAIFLYVCAAKE
jgi:ubiquinone/menaquinone biosynthesis C-methylase UbiE